MFCPYSCDKGKVMVLPAKLLLVRHTASGAEVWESGQLKVNSRYCKKFANHVMFVNYARLAWLRYSADGLDANFVLTFKEQDALTRPESSFTGVTVSFVVVP